MKRCTLVIPDAGPFNSLWVADELGLLLALDMPIVVIDAIYGTASNGWASSSPRIGSSAA